jgi:hypothetical protein
MGVIRRMRVTSSGKLALGEDCIYACVTSDGEIRAEAMSCCIVCLSSCRTARNTTLMYYIASTFQASYDWVKEAKGPIFQVACHYGFAGFDKESLLPYPHRRKQPPDQPQ